jgi:hypothetical protein
MTDVSSVEMLLDGAEQLGDVNRLREVPASRNRSRSRCIA